MSACNRQVEYSAKLWFTEAAQVMVHLGLLICSAWPSPQTTPPTIWCLRFSGLTDTARRHRADPCVTLGHAAYLHHLHFSTIRPECVAAGVSRPVSCAWLGRWLPLPCTVSAAYVRQFSHFARAVAIEEQPAVGKIDYSSLGFCHWNREGGVCGRYPAACDAVPGRAFWTARPPRTRIKEPHLQRRLRTCWKSPSLNLQPVPSGKAHGFSGDLRQ